MVRRFYTKRYDYFYIDRRLWSYGITMLYCDCKYRRVQPLYGIWWWGVGTWNTVQSSSQTPKIVTSLQSRSLKSSAPQTKLSTTPSWQGNLANSYCLWTTPHPGRGRWLPIAMLFANLLHLYDLICFDVIVTKVS